MASSDNLELNVGSIDKHSKVPAHVQVGQRLTELLDGGDLTVGQRLPSEPEIARHFGVSRMTANKAILALVADGLLTRERGRGTFVAERREKHLTRCLVAMHPYSVAGAQDDYYYGALYWSIRGYFQNKDMRIDVGYLPPDVERRPALLDGAAVISINPALEAAETLANLHRLGKPVVVLGSSWESSRVNAVDSDNLLGAALAVNHLVDLGHRSIGFIGAWPQNSNTADRLRGFQIALKARGLSAHETDMIVTPNDEGLGTKVSDHLAKRLTDASPLTAVFAAGPRLALQLLSLAQQLGVDVPGRLSIVAYDDPSFLRFTNPSLTTIQQPLQEMARRACEIVTEGGHSHSEGPRVVLLDPELVIRESTASPSLVIPQQVSVT
jgi:DNA-binding LacI/PurR family transcriptional regulator/DNA-binding transcriptional regulator YhcF (GntR family)